LQKSLFVFIFFCTEEKQIQEKKKKVGIFTYSAFLVHQNIDYYLHPHIGLFLLTLEIHLSYEKGSEQRLGIQTGRLLV
jgi:hypothetical protein